MTNLSKRKTLSKIIDESLDQRASRSKIGIRFYERFEKTKVGESIIYVSITFKGKSGKKSTGIICKRNTFNSSTYEVSNDETASYFIQKLNGLIKETITEFRITSRTIDPKLILDVVFRQTNLNDNSPTIFDILQTIEITESKRQLVGEIKWTTLKRTRLCIERFNEFNYQRFKTKHLRLSSYQIVDSKDYPLWLKSNYFLKNATIRKHIQLARKVFAIAVENKWHDFNPFEYVKVQEKSGVNIENHLLFHHIKGLKDLKFLNNEIYERIRDSFLFQCFTGLSFSDMKALRKSNIKEIEGSKVLIISRTKTSKPAIIPLFGYSLEYLDKYSEGHGELCIPTYSQTHHNRVLKELAMMANIDVKLSTHTARRTFGHLMLSNGLSKESLQSIYGHTSIKTTEQHYVKSSVTRSIQEMKTITSKISQL